MADSVNLELDTIRILIGQIRNGDQAAQSDLINQIESYVMMGASRNLSRGVSTDVRRVRDSHSTEKPGGFVVF